MSYRFDEARIAGVIDIPRYCGNCFRVFTDHSNCVTIQTSHQPIDVYWSGASIIAEFADGEMRRYYDLSEGCYELIYR